jgi:phosphomannomutase
MEAMTCETSNPLAAGKLSVEDKKCLDRARALILDEPATSFTGEMMARKLGIETARAVDCLEYLADLEREFEVNPRHKGVAKVLIRGTAFYEALSDNPDVRRDYDYRATNEGGRDFCPKNMLYYVWAWINLAEAKCAKHRIANNQTVLITNDCRYYPEAIIEAAKMAARWRGYKAVFAFADGKDPSCVSSYSHAVRLTRPVLALFITASHVSRPAENTVVGAKVAMLGVTGQLESLSTKDIKIATAREIHRLKKSSKLSQLLKPIGAYEEIDVSDSHTRMATAGVLVAMGHFPGTTLCDLAQQLKTATDIDARVKAILPADIPALFEGLTIVIEAAHTSSGKLAEKAFKALGTRTTLLHGDVRRVQGLHQADPSITQNLKHLFDEMLKSRAHLGLAFDLDGDRGAIVLLNKEGAFSVLAPDKLSQVLIPFLMNEGGYRQAPKPMYVRDCLATDAVLDQGRLSGVAVETTDAGYVFLKKRENDMAKKGFLTIGMGEASGHAWLDYTGPFENPILVALLFTAMCAKKSASAGGHSAGRTVPPEAVEEVFTSLAIPYRKSTRFQPLFAKKFVEQAAQDPRNDTAWSPNGATPIPQKLISLCRSISIQRLQAFFRVGLTIPTPLGALRVDQFRAEWDRGERIYRFGKIYFSLDNTPVGSFVSRGSSNDPTAVQVWEVKEFEGATWNGTKLPEEVIQQRFDLIGGVVLVACEALHILELVDRKPAANMAGVLPSVQRLPPSVKQYLEATAQSLPPSA